MVDLTSAMLNLRMTELDRGGYELVLDERFDQGALNERVWLPYHLPHWSSRDRSAARYRLAGHGLELLIEADQPPWYAEIGEWTRVSTLQTGEFAGPVGSEVGQYRLKPELVVVEEQPNVALFTTQFGLIECRARAIPDEANSVALWLIGYEDEPERSAEICVFEIFGRHMDDDQAKVGMGIHPHGDPSIQEDFSREPVAIDARASHTYAASWTPDGRFLLCGRAVGQGR